MSVDVARLRELLAKAPPLPWAWDEHTLRGKDRNAVFYPHASRHMQTPRSLLNDDSNADLIVAAVNALPALLDENERLTQALRKIAIAGSVKTGSSFDEASATGDPRLEGLADMARAALAARPDGEASG